MPKGMRKGDSYRASIRRSTSNSVARRVKLADLEDSVAHRGSPCES